MPENEMQPIWERQEGENPRWFARFLLYRNLEPARRFLLSAYVACINTAEKGGKKRPRNIKVPGSWNAIFEKWRWKARAEAYDAFLHAEAEARAQALRDAEAAEIERIMTSGYALLHKRIQGLDQMANDICASFTNEQGELDFRFMSPDKIREYRGCLDDIAKELGARKVKAELTGKNDGPIDFIVDWGGGAIEEESEDAQDKGEEQP